MNACTNERSSADSLFRKGIAKLYSFHFEQHLVFILPELQPEVLPGIFFGGGHY